jgi:CheY-like chemotaxis protein
MSDASRLGQDQLSILLVDDNIFIRNLIANCLRHMGFRGMHGFSSGIKTIEFIKPPPTKTAKSPYKPCALT